MGSDDDITEFVWVTGGGKGEVKFDDERKRLCHSEWEHFEFREQNAPECFRLLGNPSVTNEGEPRSPSGELGFGRIEFAGQEGSLMPYVRIPWNRLVLGSSKQLTSSPAAMLYYVENVWELPRPKLLISVTGGTQDFPMTRTNEKVLYKLMEAARQTHAWIITAGTSAGIMKYVGSKISDLLFLFKKRILHQRQPCHSSLVIENLQ